MTKGHRIKKQAGARIPTGEGEFQLFLYQEEGKSEEHLALVMGEVDGQENTLVRVHSECFTGDVLGSLRCDCRDQLTEGLRAIQRDGRGILLYLRQEGRGIGLLNKLRAYALQDRGRDTVEANEQLGFEADLRDYATAVHMFRLLGVTSLRLMSNNPRKLEGVTGDALVITERVPLEVEPSDANRRYLKTKKDKLGHQLTSV